MNMINIPMLMYKNWLRLQKYENLEGYGF